ncbi:hypothetical protein BGZ51_006602 [Haplosporangium sp. Z 767]|nr:hypothetical protein BGZ50_003037 [Haplosporangium sp. Z 11]KAF9191882.1 hypothetical protein BGZ51_006602 [Haplosporangium sp. Z 767]
MAQSEAKRTRVNTASKSISTTRAPTASSSSSSPSSPAGPDSTLSSRNARMTGRVLRQKDTDQVLMDMEHDEEGSAALDGSGIHSRSSTGGQHSRPPAASPHNMSSPVSRRFPYCHTHHHLYQAQNTNNISNSNNNSSSSSSNAATTSGRTHIRNYSSPSLLDSFTSPDPMLSPIQSYFGSDPNSPASSFSLPRHDQYPRLSIDLDSMGDAGTTDGYHGFATHPWSEQSTTPARALSHRWTRRLSQPDAYPSQSNSNSNDHDHHHHSSSSGPRRSSIGLSQPFAPAIMDQQWSENTPVVVAHMDTSTVSQDESNDVDNDLVASEDPSQESADEIDMEDNYDGLGAYHHEPGDLANPNDAGYLDSARPYAYRYTTLNQPMRLRDPRPVDCEDDEDMDHAMYEVEHESNLRRFTDLVNGLNQAHRSMGDDNEMAQSQGMDPIRGTEAVHPTEYIFDQTSPSQSALASSYREDLRARSVRERANVRIPESDEELARRLQDEEYVALMGERDNSASAAFLSGSLLRSSTSTFAPTSSSRHRSLRAIPRLAAYSARDRHQFSTLRPRTAESRSPHMRPLNAFPSPRFGEIAPQRATARDSRPLGRPFGARTAFIQAHSVNSSVQDRPSSRSTPRSPSPTQSSTIVDLGEDILRYTRTLQHLTRLIQEQQVYSRSSEQMWGNPADYLDDDQVDDSYEGLLRLSERIGDAVPRGVSAHTLQKLDKHIVSWKQLKCTNATNSNTVPSTLRHTENESSVSVSTSAMTRNNSSSPSPASPSSSFSCITRSQIRSKEDLAINDSPDENCTICLQTFEQSDYLRPLPCRHAFHVDCIDEWLRQSAQCPICRQEVTATAATSMSFQP